VAAAPVLMAVSAGQLSPPTAGSKHVGTASSVWQSNSAHSSQQTLPHSQLMATSLNPTARATAAVAAAAAAAAVPSEPWTLGRPYAAVPDQVAGAAAALAAEAAATLRGMHVAADAGAASTI